jgi:Ricin-type beta-trefoil lectin domain-like
MTNYEALRGWWCMAGAVVLVACGPGVVAGAPMDESTDETGEELSGINLVKVVQSGQCASVDGASTANDAAIVQLKCQGQAEQQWTLKSVAADVYTLIAVKSGKCMDVAGTAVHTPVVQETCDGGNSQKWRAVNVGNGQYELHAAESGLCLDVQGSAAAAGAAFQLYPCHDANNQRFTFAPVDNTSGGGTGGSGGSSGDPGPGAPNGGWAQWTGKFTLQNWTEQPDSQHFGNLGNGEYWTKLTKGDWAPGTKGRVEMRWPNWPDQGAENMISADVMYETGTEGTCIMQIKTNTGSKGHESIYLVVKNGGNVYHGVNNTVIVSHGFSVWHNIKAAYNPKTGLARVWIDNTLKFQQHYDPGTGAVWYFKNGTYWASATSRAHFKNITFWRNPN